MKTATLTTGQSYHNSISAPISPIDAYEKISDVPVWWAQNYEGSAKNLDDIFTVRFGETFVVFKISDAILGVKYTWEVIDCYLHWLNDKTEWTGTSVVFEISEHNNITTINMTHVGLVPEVECFDNCVKGWDRYIKESLFKYITEGQGIPQLKGRH